MKTKMLSWRYLAIVALLATLLSTTNLALADSSLPGIVPPNLTYAGLTYGEWSAAWWQWAYSIPVNQSPFIDSTGANCAVAQSGPVFNLAGTFDAVQNQPGRLVGAANRTCSVPAGAAVFIPVLNGECSVVEGNYDPSLPGTMEEQLRACAVDLINHVTVAQATVDGIPVSNLQPNNSIYRVQSPLFTFKLPKNNVLGLKSGTSPAVADGYMVMLWPLSAGQHTLKINAQANFPEYRFSFKIDITYILNVAQ